MEKKTVNIESLRPVTVLCEGDMYDLARLLLRLEDAKAVKKGHRGRPTLHGLAAAYAYLVRDMDTKQVEAVLREHGLPLGATVEQS